MEIMKKTLLALLMVIGTLISKGQQDPMYSQYIFNLQTVNPAYVGYWQTTGLTALSRDQWVGITGHPTTQTLSFQTPLRSQNVGIGFNVVKDQVGLEKRLMFNIDYSYQIMLTDNSSLRFGIKGGFTNYSNNLGQYVQNNPNDPLFQGDIQNKFMPNFGIGMFLSNPKYYISLSLPALLQSKYQPNANNFATTTTVRHLFVAGGMMFDLSDNLKFKPSIMTQTVVGAPFLYDISANFLIAEKFWVGAMYRSGDAVAAIAQWIINKKLRFGYAYDFTTTDLRNYNRGVHEVMISYEFVVVKHKYISPRYF